MVLATAYSLLGRIDCEEVGNQPGADSGPAINVVSVLGKGASTG